MTGKIIANSILPSIVTALVIYVFANEQGLMYSALRYDDDQITMKLFKVGNYTSDVDNRYVISISAPEDDQTKLGRFKILRKQIFNEDLMSYVDIEDQTDTQKKIEVSLSNGQYLVSIPYMSPQGPEAFDYLVKHIDPQSSKQPRRASPFMAVLLPIYFNFIPILVLAIVVSFLFIRLIKFIRRKKVNTIELD